MAATTRTFYTKEIERIATRHDLDPVLVTAVVMAESKGFTDAFRHEPGYYRRYIKGKAEWDGWNPRRVASSYGLMQVMYPTALMNGWQGDPEELFLPEVGINAGCARLAFLIKWAERLADQRQGDVVHDPTEAALAAYNGGKKLNEPWRDTLRNQSYVTKIHVWIGKLRG